MIAIIKRVLRRIVILHDKYSIMARNNSEGGIIDNELIVIFLFTNIEDDDLEETGMNGLICKSK
jgi:hypothetical protein